MSQANDLRTTKSDEWMANLLGAFALALTDGIRRSIETASRLGFTDSAALATVAASPAEPLDCLARTLRLSGAGTSRLVDRLQTEGLMMRRTGDSDNRSRAVVLTDAGLERANLVLASRRTALLRALTPLSAEEREALGRLLETMLTALTPDRETSEHTCRLCDIAVCPKDICPVELAALRTEG
jgi:DNA-binding MarR family transcriptional regulator